MTSRPSPTPEDTCAEIAALLTQRIPGSDPERLHSLIAALGLLPAHARRLLTYLTEHRDALTAGDPAGPAAVDLRRRLAKRDASLTATDIRDCRCRVSGVGNRFRDEWPLCYSLVPRVACGLLRAPRVRSAPGRTQFL